MIRIDERTARTLSQLKTPSMAPLLEYWKAQRADILEQLTQVATDVQIYRLQGEASALKQMLELTEKADSLIVKLRK